MTSKVSKIIEQREKDIGMIERRGDDLINQMKKRQRGNDSNNRVEGG